MHAKIRGTEIYFDIAGTQLPIVNNKLTERPVLFLLHGGPGGNHLRYKQHSIELQDVAQLVFIDHRGCGLSKKTKRKDYTMENNIEDIEALRKHLGLKRICMLGTSYGGMVAQGYAIRYPQHLAKLILVVTAPSYRFMDEAKNILRERGNAQQNSIAKHLWNGTFRNPNHVLEFFKQMEALYSLAPKKKGQEIYTKTKIAWSHQALNEAFSGFLHDFDFIPKLKKITCPTLVLGGKNDWICPPDQSAIIAHHIPHSQLKIFKHCGHALALDAHKQYIEAVRKFLIRRVSI